MNMILCFSTNPDGGVLSHLGCIPFICGTVSYSYSHNEHNTEKLNQAQEKMMYSRDMVYTGRTRLLLAQQHIALP